MTDMSPAEAVFYAALEKTTPVERAAYLAEACGADADLRRRVERLLAVQSGVGSFLEAPAGGHTAAWPTPSEPAGEVGAVVAGKYKLLERIGEGGMGSVFMAEQTEPVRRLVAVKLIKPGMDSKTVLARFEAERQALALMDHPNIAKVLDAGATADGRPYFVMELVKGTPITAFCDERKLTPRERLELFVPVCQAIQHAHQKGVIHRDIKPTNVLVALYDGRPVPKVIDFGVAKATGQPLTERTLHTHFGALVGTPEYMSPEQATFNQLDIDTRSDVYALGVLLYELLTGTTPVDRERLGKAALLEVLRIVREDEPSRPSVKLSTASTRAGIAATRGTEPGRLSKLLRGELDWIVMKALEKDRARRYDTAAGFARDVQRYLADELVEARPPSAGYRLRKFLWRNRGGVIGAGTGLLALTLMLGFSLLQSRKARYAEHTAVAAHAEAEAHRREAEANERQAKAAAKEAAAVTAFISTTVIGAQTKGHFLYPMRDISLSEALLNAEPSVAGTFREQPLAEATIRYFLGSGLLSLGKAAAGAAQFERAYSIRKDVLGPAHPDTVLVMHSLGVAYVSSNRPARAIEVLKEALDIMRKHPELEERVPWPIAGTLADLYEEAKRFDEALPLRRQAVARHRESGDTQRGLADALHTLGQSLLLAGRPTEAEPILRESQAIYDTNHLLPMRWFRFAVTADLGASLLAQKKYAAAEQLLLKGYNGLKAAEGTDLNSGPLIGDDYLPDIAAKLAELYEATNQPAKAAAWRAKHAGERGPEPRVVKP